NGETGVFYSGQNWQPIQYKFERALDTSKYPILEIKTEVIAGSFDFQVFDINGNSSHIIGFQKKTGQQIIKVNLYSLLTSRSTPLSPIIYGVRLSQNLGTDTYFEAKIDYLAIRKDEALIETFTDASNWKPANSTAGIWTDG